MSIFASFYSLLLAKYYLKFLLVNYIFYFIQVNKNVFSFSDVIIVVNDKGLGGKASEDIREQTADGWEILKRD